MQTTLLNVEQILLDERFRLVYIHQKTLGVVNKTRTKHTAMRRVCACGHGLSNVRALTLAYRVFLIYDMSFWLPGSPSNASKHSVRDRRSRYIDVI